MKKYLFISFVFLGFLAFANVASAQSQLPSDITFPIQELGNCKDKTACATYCDKPENVKVCIDFAKAQGMISSEEASIAEKILETTGTIGGPGGCKSENECRTYCDNINNIEVCVSFAEVNNLMSSNELKEAKMAMEAIKKGAKPPAGCRGKKECDAYCSTPENVEECVAFGEAAGFISPNEAAMIRKTGGKGPGGCQGKETCDSYCSDPNNMEQCMNFALENNLMPPEEAKQAQQVLQAIKAGVKPPPCRGEKECQEYCSKPENSEACINFAIAAGFIPAEEAEQMRKMAKAGLMGGGPGGCKGKEECDKFCQDPNNMVTCVDFAEKAGMMSPEEAAKTRKMAELGMTGGPGGCKGESECNTYCQDQSHMQECMDFAVKAGMMKPEEAERANRMMQIGEAATGPGGCKTREECGNYCSDSANAQECLDFAQKSGMMNPQDVKVARQFSPGGQGGPGGCQGQDECKDYCQDPAHLDECSNFSVQQGIISPEEAQGMKQMMERREQMMPVSPGFPAELQGKCTNEEGCLDYCKDNQDTPACRGMMQAIPQRERPEMPPGLNPENRAPGIMPGGEEGVPGGIMKPPTPEEIENIKEREIQRIMPQIPQGVPGGSPASGIPGGGQMPQATQVPQNIPEPFQNIPNTAPNP